MFHRGLVLGAVSEICQIVSFIHSLKRVFISHLHAYLDHSVIFAITNVTYEIDIREEINNESQHDLTCWILLGGLLRINYGRSL